MGEQAAMKQQDEEELKNRMVCFCYTVQLQVLRAAIQSGAKSLEAIKAETKASTGCGGCEWDVLAILEEEFVKGEKQK